MLYGYDQEDFYSVGWRDGFKTFIVKQDELEKALYLRDLNINMFWGTVLLDVYKRQQLHRTGSRISTKERVSHNGGFNVAEPGFEPGAALF